jgi:hypothetical protein
MNTIHVWASCIFALAAAPLLASLARPNTRFAIG